jgi:hypothetical protein
MRSRPERASPSCNRSNAPIRFWVLDSVLEVRSPQPDTRRCAAGGFGCLALCEGHLANNKGSVRNLCTNISKAVGASLLPVPL